MSSRILRVSVKSAYGLGPLPTVMTHLKSGQSVRVEPQEIRMDLPEPPSANRYVRSGRGRHYTPKKVTDFRAAVTATYLREFATTRIAYPDGDLRLVITWRRKRKSGDLSNRIKILEDALKGLAYKDDKQVVELQAFRRDDKQNPGCTVTISRAA